MGAKCGRICLKGKKGRSENYNEQGKNHIDHNDTKFEIIVKNVRGISLNCVKTALIREKQPCRSSSMAAKPSKLRFSSIRLI